MLVKQAKGCRDHLVICRLEGEKTFLSVLRERAWARVALGVSSIQRVQRARGLVSHPTDR